MSSYGNAILRQLRDVYKFTPEPGSTEELPVFKDVPDGEYPMTIAGKVDNVFIRDGRIYHYNLCTLNESDET